MEFIQVELLKTVAAAFSGGDSVSIDVFINKVTGDKYYSFVVSDITPTSQTFKYPNVNPMVFSLMDYIEQRGPTTIENGILYGPHLTRESTTQQGYCLGDETTTEIVVGDHILPMETPLRLEDYFATLVQ